ncbi:hypothetical protein A8A54_19080 [Brucella pseudogrignonensis]|uniref:TRAP transporter substrate-binding protein n=1 Tax=Brucella pseudogrignonensis TaxID=419475 RepID=UPI0007DA517D|nr:TRAP transporter substrate-binding protein [Brucella pseudogrignonensis]ANG98713.1 hypothetical protein A8A54_19080 [Brucella pseudogrignonensis]
MTRFNLRGLVTAAMMMAWAGPSLAETIIFSANDVEANFHTQNARLFAEDVARISDGALNVNVVSGSALLSRAELKRGIQRRVVAVGDMLTGALANEDPAFAVEGIPMLAVSPDKVDLLWQITRPIYEEELGKAGIMVLWGEAWPATGIYSAREITTPDDLSGMRMRAYNGTSARFISLLGGVPATIPSAEISQAFSTGVVSGMLTSSTTGVDTQAWDFASFFYNLEMLTPTNLILMNRDRFEALSPDQQAAVLEAARLAEERGWRMARDEQDKAVQKLRDNGMQVRSELPPAVQEVFDNAAATMLAEWRNRSPAVTRIVADYEAALAAQPSAGAAVQPLEGAEDAGND